MNTIIVTGTVYLDAFKVRIEFSDHTWKVIDFEQFLKENQHPQWAKYNKINNFKKFKIENGNLVWGRNWDLIFPIYGLYTDNILSPCC